MKTNDFIAYCGLACKTCPIHLASFEADQEIQLKKRIEILKICTEQYGMKLLLEEITDCDGCKAETGRLFSSCQNCEIRKCARGKKLECCAYCDQYACEILTKFFVSDPSARTRLDGIRSAS